MRKLLTLCAVLLFTCAMGFAETFTGKLVDANCAAQQKSAVCTPTASTSSFALEVGGKLLKLDATGNRKAAAAIQESNSTAERAQNPNGPAEPVMATVDGTRSGNTIKVQSISIQ